MNQRKIVHYCPVCGTDVGAVQVALDFKHPEESPAKIDSPQPPPEKKRSYKKRVLVTPEIKEEIQRLRAEGRGPAEIGRLLNINPKTVGSYIYDPDRQPAKAS